MDLRSISGWAIISLCWPSFMKSGQLKKVKTLNLDRDQLPIEKAHWAQWNVQKDLFTLSMEVKRHTFTRCGIQSGKQLLVKCMILCDFWHLWSCQWNKSCKKCAEPSWNGMRKFLRTLLKGSKSAWMSSCSWTHSASAGVLLQKILGTWQQHSCIISATPARLGTVGFCTYDC